MKTALACSLTALLTGSAAHLLNTTPPADAAPRSVEAILRSYVEDFRADPAAAEARTFGVQITGEGGGAWSVVISGVETADGAFSVELVEGMPEEPTFYYTLDSAVLRTLDDGRMNAISAMGKAFSTDSAPMEDEFMPGAAPFDNNSFSFHFWTRGWPEVVPFGSLQSRVLHGVDCVGIYYETGLRTIFSSIKKGQRANNGPGQPIVVPFPCLAFGISGRATGTVAGKEVELGAGEAMLIPPMSPYEWWNEDDEPAEALLVFFGDGA